uniref:basic proline-rich protein-like n=1 Tax=Callithrix jacchus TaxID=9483 RepID=UPI0023DD5BB4|nr:basic proline-rich protein-like [Callithrix jacchus]
MSHGRAAPDAPPAAPGGVGIPPGGAEPSPSPLPRQSTARDSRSARCPFQSSENELRGGGLQRGAPGDPQAAAPPRPGLRPRRPGARRPSHPRPHVLRGCFLPLPPPRCPPATEPRPGPLPPPPPHSPQAPSPAASPPPRGSIPDSPGPLCSAREGSHPQPPFARGRRASQPAKQRWWRRRPEKAQRRRRRGRCLALRPAHGSLGLGVLPPTPAPEACWHWTTSPGRPRGGAGIACAQRGSLGARVQLPKGSDCISRLAARRVGRATWSLSRRALPASPSRASRVCERRLGVVSDVTAAGRLLRWALPCAALVRARQLRPGALPA